MSIGFIIGERHTGDVQWFDLFGWAGAVVFLAVYLLTSTGRLSTSSRRFQVLNIAGAAGFCIAGAGRQAWPSFTLNLLWIGIGGVMLARLLARRYPSPAA